jgi:hypothetical protein
MTKECREAIYNMSGMGVPVPPWFTRELDKVEQKIITLHKELQAKLGK